MRAFFSIAPDSAERGARWRTGSGYVSLSISGEGVAEEGLSPSTEPLLVFFVVVGGVGVVVVVVAVRWSIRDHPIE